MKNLPKAVQVEGVEFPFLQGAGGPSSTAVQQCIDGASVGHCHIFLCRELGVLSDACSDGFFCEVASRHSHKTKLVSKLSYCIGAPRTNYGIFNIRSTAAKCLNGLDENYTKFLPFKSFKIQIKENFIADISSYH